MPVPTAVPPCASRCRRGVTDISRAVAPSICACHPPSSCAERDRHGIHQVRAAGLDHVAEFGGSSGPRPCAGARAPAANARAAAARRRRGSPWAPHHCCSGSCSRDRLDAPAATARAPRALRSPHWRSCCCWCRTRSERHRPGIARRNGPRPPRAPPPGSPPRVLRQIAEIGVGGGRGMLDEPKRANEGPRHAQTRGGKILQGALGLGAPQGARRHVKRAHAVVLDASGCCHRALLRVLRLR